MASATSTVSLPNAGRAYQHYEACRSTVLADLCKKKFFAGEPVVKAPIHGFWAKAKHVAKITQNSAKLTGYHTFKLLDAFLLDQAAMRIYTQVRDRCLYKTLTKAQLNAVGEGKAEILTRLGRLDRSSKLYKASLWLRISESVLFLVGTALAFAPKIFSKISAFGLKAMGIAASCCSLIFMGVFFAVARSIEMYHDWQAIKATKGVIDDLRIKVESSSGNERTLYLLRLDALERVTYLSQKLDFCQKIFDTIVTTAGYLTAGIAMALGASIGNYFLVVAVSIVTMSVVISIIHNSIWAVNVCSHNQLSRNWIEAMPEGKLPGAVLEQIAKDRQVLDANGHVSAERVTNLDMVLWLKGEVFGPV